MYAADLGIEHEAHDQAQGLGDNSKHCREVALASSSFDRGKRTEHGGL